MDARKRIYIENADTIFTLNCTSNSAHSGSFSDYLEIPFLRRADTFSQRVAEIPFLRGADTFSQRVAHWLELVALRWALCPGILVARIVHWHFFGFLGGEGRK